MTKRIRDHRQRPLHRSRQHVCGRDVTDPRSHHTHAHAPLKHSTHAHPAHPQNIHQGPDGRWYHDDTDVTDHPFAWKCAQGHTWHASLAVRTGGNDPGCPTCNPTPLDPAAAVPEPVNLEAFTAALTTAYDLVPTNIDNATRQETAQAAYQALLAFLDRNRTLIGVYDDEGGMTTLHHGYAVGIHGD